MNRNAHVYLHQAFVGSLAETDEGYEFIYDEIYFHQLDAEPVSLTLPLAAIAYRSTVLFQFFDGLIPEGWLLDIAEKN